MLLRLSLLLLIASNQTFAQTRVDPVFVTGTNAQPPESESPPPRSPQSATIVLVTKLGIAELQRLAPERLEAALGYQIGINTGIEQTGLGTAVVVRGVELNNRVYLNGQLDFQRRFVRDFSTVESVLIARGPATATFGFASPAAVIEMRTPQARVGAAPFASVSMSAGDAQFSRFLVDVGTPCGAACAVRAIAVSQQGHTLTPGADADRNNVLLAAKVQLLAASQLRIELERQQNTRQFSFGTVVLSGTPIFDVSYNAPQSKALRRYERGSVYLEHAVSSVFDLYAAYSDWRLFRDESLVGYFAIQSPTRLSGYYTAYVDHARQSSSLVSARMKASALGAATELSVGYEANTARALLDGEQQIGSFTLDPRAPDFSNALSGLKPLRRYRADAQRDDGAFAQARAAWDQGTTAMISARYSRFDQFAGRTVALAPALSVSGEGWSHQIGAQQAFGPEKAHFVYLNAARSTEPNSGVLHSGDFLPPKQSTQIEAGWRVEQSRSQATVALFHIERRNDPAPDPQDRLASVAIGKRLFRGVEVSGRAEIASFALEAGVAYLTANTPNLIAALPAQRPPNVPRWSGNLTLRHSGRAFERPLQWWAGAVLVGQRYGDAGNTFTVPGYARFDAGVLLKLSAVDLALNARNIADKRYISAITSADNALQGERRTVWLTARFGW